MGSSPELQFGDLREMNMEEMDLYYRVVGPSEGFDAPHFPDSYAIGAIEPMTRYPLPDEVKECAEKAIQHYNDENGTNFEFVKNVKANHQASRGILYYITFEVKQVGAPPDSPTTIFQARVLAGLFDIIEVQLCRPQPTLL